MTLFDERRPLDAKDKKKSAEVGHEVPRKIITDPRKLEDELKKDGVLVVIFTELQKCVPCKKLEANMSQFIGEAKGFRVVSLDIRGNWDAVEKFDVIGTPDLRVYVNGEKVAQMPGYYEDQLASFFAGAGKRSSGTYEPQPQKANSEAVIAAATNAPKPPLPAVTQGVTEEQLKEMRWQIHVPAITKSTPQPDLIAELGSRWKITVPSFKKG